MAPVRGEIQIGNPLGADGGAAWSNASQIEINISSSLSCRLVPTEARVAPDPVVPPIFSDHFAIRRFHLIMVCPWGEARYMYPAENTMRAGIDQGKALDSIALAGLRSHWGADRLRLLGTGVRTRVPHACRRGNRGMKDPTNEAAE